MYSYMPIFLFRCFFLLELILVYISHYYTRIFLTLIRRRLEEKCFVDLYPISTPTRVYESYILYSNHKDISNDKKEGCWVGGTTRDN